MSEPIYSELHDEQPHSTSSFELIKSLDRSVRELNDNLYDLKRDANSRLARLDEDVAKDTNIKNNIVFNYMKEDII